MLVITIPARDDAFDEETNTFVKIDSQVLKLEHSLLSLWKWESKHHKYFLENKDLSQEEIIDYIKCMTLNQVDDKVYKFLTVENVKQITDYIEDPMTATWFNDNLPNGKPPAPKSKDIITAEVIYSSMIALGIPVDIFEKRHLNHLLTLIRVCNETQNPDTNNKKVSEYQQLRHYQELNRARKAKAAAKKKV